MDPSGGAGNRPVGRELEQDHLSATKALHVYRWLQAMAQGFLPRRSVHLSRLASKRNDFT